MSKLSKVFNDVYVLCPVSYLAVDILELLDSIRKGNNFSWTNKGEVQRVKIDDHVLSLQINSVRDIFMKQIIIYLVVFKGNFFELPVNHSLSLECRGRLLDVSSQEGRGA